MPFCSAYPNRRLANAMANYYVALVHLFFFAYSFLYFVSSNSQTSPTCSPKNPSEEFENRTAASSTLSDPNCDIESIAIQRFREIFAPILTYKGIALGSALVAWIPSWYLLERCPYTVIWTTGYWAGQAKDSGSGIRIHPAYGIYIRRACCYPPTQQALEA